jgi:hypothetical protein
MKLIGIFFGLYLFTIQTYAETTPETGIVAPVSTTENTAASVAVKNANTDESKIQADLNHSSDSNELINSNNSAASESRAPASWIDATDESKIIDMAKHRLYPGGQNEQDLEVQKQLQKPQKSPGSANEGGSEAPVREEEF